MFKKSPLFYSTWAVIVSAIYSLCELTFLHPKNNAWALVPAFALITFIANLLSRDSEKRNKTKKTDMHPHQQ